MFVEHSLDASRNLSYHCTGITGSGNSRRNFFKTLATHCGLYEFKSALHTSENIISCGFNYPLRSMMPFPFLFLFHELYIRLTKLSRTAVCNAIFRVPRTFQVEVGQARSVRIHIGKHNKALKSVGIIIATNRNKLQHYLSSLRVKYIMKRIN